MSIWSDITKGVGRILRSPAATAAVSSLPIGAAITSGIRVASSVAQAVARPVAAAIGPAVASVVRSPAVSAVARGAVRALPGVGAAVVGGGIAAALSGGGAAPRRRRGRGFSSRDIRQTRRMLRLIKEMSAACPRPRTVRASRCK